MVNLHESGLKATKFKVCGYVCIHIYLWARMIDYPSTLRYLSYTTIAIIRMTEP